MTRNDDFLKKVETRLRTFLQNKKHILFSETANINLTLNRIKNSGNASIILEPYRLKGDVAFVKFEIRFQFDDEKGIWKETEFSIQFEHIYSKVFFEEDDPPKKIKAGNFHFRYDKTASPDTSHPKIHIHTFSKIKSPRYSRYFDTNEFVENDVQSIATLIEVLKIVENQILWCNNSTLKKEVPIIITDSINNGNSYS